MVNLNCAELDDGVAGLISLPSLGSVFFAPVMLWGPIRAGIQLVER